MLRGKWKKLRIRVSEGKCVEDLVVERNPRGPVGEFLECPGDGVSVYCLQRFTECKSSVIGCLLDGRKVLTNPDGRVVSCPVRVIDNVTGMLYDVPLHEFGGRVHHGGDVVEYCEPSKEKVPSLDEFRTMVSSVLDEAGPMYLVWGGLGTLLGGRVRSVQRVFGVSMLGVGGVSAADRGVDALVAPRAFYSNSQYRIVCWHFGTGRTLLILIDGATSGKCIHSVLVEGEAVGLVHNVGLLNRLYDFVRPVDAMREMMSNCRVDIRGVVVVMVPEREISPIPLVKGGRGIGLTYVSRRNAMWSRFRVNFPYASCVYLVAESAADVSCETGCPVTFVYSPNNFVAELTYRRKLDAQLVIDHLIRYAIDGQDVDWLTEGHICAEAQVRYRWGFRSTYVGDYDKDPLDGLAVSHVAGFASSLAPATFPILRCVGHAGDMGLYCDASNSRVGLTTYPGRTCRVGIRYCLGDSGSIVGFDVCDLKGKVLLAAARTGLRGQLTSKMSVVKCIPTAGLVEMIIDSPSAYRTHVLHEEFFLLFTNADGGRASSWVTQGPCRRDRVIPRGYRELETSWLKFYVDLNSRNPSKDGVYDYNEKEVVPYDTVTDLAMEALIRGWGCVPTEAKVVG